MSRPRRAARAEHEAKRRRRAYKKVGLEARDLRVLAAMTLAERQRFYTMLRDGGIPSSGRQALLRVAMIPLAFVGGAGVFILVYIALYVFIEAIDAARLVVFIIAALAGLSVTVIGIVTAVIGRFDHPQPEPVLLIARVGRDTMDVEGLDVMGAATGSGGDTVNLLLAGRRLGVSVERACALHADGTLHSAPKFERVTHVRASRGSRIKRTMLPGEHVILVCYPDHDTSGLALSGRLRDLVRDLPGDAAAHPNASLPHRRADPKPPATG